MNELKLIDINKNNINSKRRKRSYEKENNLMIFVNKKKPNETYNKNKNDKNDDLIYLLDNIKTKYQKQENKYINQQKNMKSEIEILREKLKALSVNEALYQVEIEKLKRKNINNNNELNNNDIINNLKKDFLKKNWMILFKKIIKILLIVIYIHFLKKRQIINWNNYWNYLT